MPQKLAACLKPRPRLKAEASRGRPMGGLGFTEDRQRGSEACEASRGGRAEGATRASAEGRGEARARQAVRGGPPPASQSPQTPTTLVVNAHTTRSSPSEDLVGSQVGPKGPSWASSRWRLLGASPYAPPALAGGAVTFCSARPKAVRYPKFLRNLGYIPPASSQRRPKGADRARRARIPVEE